MPLPLTARDGSLPSRRRLPVLVLLALTPLGAGCDRQGRPPDPAHDESGDAEPWAVTAWGELYEVFPEIDPLVEGRPAESHTHVTTLADFSPLDKGTVAIVLRGADGSEEVFSASSAKRPGIFPVTITPRSRGAFDLFFRVESAAGREEIAGGRVRVGDASSPGGLETPPEATARAHTAAGAAAGEEIPFLKEQQWKTPFATAWAAERELAATRVAPARVVARPGGDRILTAPADGVVLASPFPHAGLRLRAGATLFALTPRLDPERSLAALEGELAGAEAELELAKTEATRARALSEGGVVSIADRQRADAALGVAAAHAESVRRDVATARRARGGGDEPGEAVRLGAPYDGAVAEVHVSAGQAVEAGEVLGRFVASGPPWIEAWVAPEAAAGLDAGLTRISLSSGTGAPPAGWTNLAARLIAVSPALDAATGRRTVLLALESEPPALVIGQSIEIELQAGASNRGVVVPATAVVDDAGVSVVYVQVEGETLSRREVRVITRAGDRRLVEGVAPGERVVTIGGSAVRRSSRVSTGVGEGHVH